MNHTLTNETPMNEIAMNESLVRGKWNMLKGKVKEQFGQLTDDDLLRADGSIDRLLGVLQMRYGYTKERAQSEWNQFIEKNSTLFQNDPANRENSDRQTSGGVLSNVAQQVQNVASNAFEQGKQVVDETLEDVKKRADSAVTEQKDEAAQKLGTVASALRSGGDELRKNDQATFAEYANSVADYVDDFSGFLRQRNPMDLWGDIQDFARRQPEVFVLGTLGAGFLLGRFLRSSDKGTNKNSFANRATPGQYQRSTGNRNAGVTASDVQTIHVQGTPIDSCEERQRFAKEGGAQPRKVAPPATLVAAPHPEDRPQAAKSV